MRIRIDIARQALELFAETTPPFGHPSTGGETTPSGFACHPSTGGETCIRRYSVSTAINGVGETDGSGCTPRGLHRIRARIGAGAPLGAVFRGRRPTGEIWTPELAAAHPERDWILSRILWLCGEEPGFNRGGRCDSMRRYIYIHGTGEDQPMGKPLSHGCIRMRNRDVIELFELTDVGTLVEIVG